MALSKYADQGMHHLKLTALHFATPCHGDQTLLRRIPDNRHILQQHNFTVKSTVRSARAIRKIALSAPFAACAAPFCP